MTRFNAPIAVATKTENLASGEAFIESPKLELASLVLTSFVQDQFYRGANETLDRLGQLLDAVPPEFAAKAAVFARNEFGMRSISHVVAGELAYRVKGQRWMKTFIAKVIRRPDDMTEILAYYIKTYGRRPLPHALRKGLALAFGSFSRYQLAKYRSEGKAVSLIDVVNLVRPKPSTENAEALEALVKDELRSEGTWEVGLTEAGQESEGKAERKAEVWADLIRSRKIGYFALLRNLRNILEQAPEVVDEACALLTEEPLIRKSLVLPFRYQTALGELEKVQTEGVRTVIVAASQALDISCGNVPKLSGKTLIAVDNSGSMQGDGGRSPIAIASLFGAVLYKTQDADLLVFSDRATWVMTNPTDSVVSIGKEIMGSLTPSGTDFRPIFDATKRYDRIIILSDMQAWEGYNSPSKPLAEYKKRTGANPHVYSWDLAGYGTLQFPEHQVYALAGFSEKVFDVMALLEEDKNALIRRIEAVALT